MNNNLRKGPRIVHRGQNGYFDIDQDSSSKEVRYVRNPETGVYEAKPITSNNKYDRNSDGQPSRREQNTPVSRSRRSNKESETLELIENKRHPQDSRRRSSSRSRSRSRSRTGKDEKPDFSDAYKNYDGVVASSNSKNERDPGESKDSSSRLGPRINARRSSLRGESSAALFPNLSENDVSRRETRNRVKLEGNTPERASRRINPSESRQDERLKYREQSEDLGVIRRERNASLDEITFSSQRREQRSRNNSVDENLPTRRDERAKATSTDEVFTPRRNPLRDRRNPPDEVRADNSARGVPSSNRAEEASEARRREIRERSNVQNVANLSLDTNIAKDRAERRRADSNNTASPSTRMEARERANSRTDTNQEELAIAPARSRVSSKSNEPAPIARRPSDRARPRNTGRISPSEGNPSQYPLSPSTFSNNRRGFKGGSQSTSEPSNEKVIKNDEDIPLTELEREELENSRRELSKQKASQREADLKEAEMVQFERERKAASDQARRGSTSFQKALVSTSSPDTSVIVADYIQAVMTTVRNDTTLSPIPEDFRDIDAYDNWRATVRISFQEILVRLIKYRFFKGTEKTNPGDSTVKINLFVMEAAELLAKEGSFRDVYCNIEFGDLESKKKRPQFVTDVKPDTLSPIWDQKLVVEAANLTDAIRIQVMDKKKGDFLGQIILPMSRLIEKTARNGRYEEWHTLEGREKNSLLGGKDKYVGGRLLLGATLQEEVKDKVGRSHNEVQALITNMDVDTRSLYDILSRACLTLDLYAVGEKSSSYLSPESVSMLKIWGNTWNISSEYRFIGYLKAVYERFEKGDIRIQILKEELEIAYSVMKKIDKHQTYDIECSLNLMRRIRNFCTDQVTRYKDAFPQNTPKDALENTIFVLRVIHRFPGFRDKYPDMPESFRDELKYMLTNSSIAKFQKFRELAAPMDQTDVTAVIEGVSNLADLVDEEVELDIKYYRAPFMAYFFLSSEIDIVRLSADIYLKNFSIYLEDCDDVLNGPQALENSSEAVFELYQLVKNMAEKHAKRVPGLTNMSVEYIENWFSPFIFKWLQQLSRKTVSWVDNALLADDFHPIANSKNGILSHSSSVSDIFSALFTNLQIFDNLGFSTSSKVARVYQSFAQTMNATIESYCERLMNSEKDSQTGISSMAPSMMAAYAQNFLGSKDVSPKDIESKSCAKLRNIAFATVKVKELYKMLDVLKITEESKEKALKDAPQEGELVTGTFTIGICYGENIKSTNSSGTSSPYITIRVPENTVSYPQEEILKRNSDDFNSKPLVLAGSQCEVCRSAILTRTRVVVDNLNPSWDESFSVFLPPIRNLELAVYSKNLIAADAVAGTAIIDFSPGTRLRKKLMDNQTHDIFVDLEPQGRILIRLTAEGNQEDIAYWFRRTNEKLIRTRDFFLRSLTEKVTPFMNDILRKGVKDNEDTPVPSSSLFQAMTVVVQYNATEYSGLTAKKYKVSEPLPEQEVDLILQPLLDYLEKNLITLCDQLPLAMARAIIERVWNELLHCCVDILVPPLYGLHSQKELLNVQKSFIETSVYILKDFFHGGGGEFGLSFEVLENQRYKQLQELVWFYSKDIQKIKREYELSIVGGSEKELLLRLARLKSENIDSERGWFISQLGNRKNK